MPKMPSTLILSPVRNRPSVLRVFLANLLAIVEERAWVKWVLLDNNSDPPALKLLRRISHPRVEVVFQDENLGKATSVNRYIGERLMDPSSRPDVIISLDSDILFSGASFDQLVMATADLSHFGMVSMRYDPGTCNPERNLILPARTYRGTSGAQWRVWRPVMCNLPGGVFGLRSTLVFGDLEGKIYTKVAGRVYYSDDGELHVRLKTLGYKHGYVDGTRAIHLASGPIELV